MSSNLTKAGWLLLLCSLILLGGSWYLAKFVLEWRFSTIQFIVGGGIALIGGGGWLLNRFGIEILK